MKAAPQYAALSESNIRQRILDEFGFDPYDLMFDRMGESALEIDGESYLNLASNDYLSLATDARRSIIVARTI